MIQTRHRTSTAGYTLVELLVVLAIIGMLAAAAVPLLSTENPKLRAKAAARALAEDLMTARQLAIDRGAEEHVVLNPATGVYAVTPQGLSRTLPKGVALALSDASRNEIAFYPDGSASGGTILVSGSGARHRVTVLWPSGRVAVDE